MDILSERLFVFSLPCSDNNSNDENACDDDGDDDVNVFLECFRPTLH